MPAVDWANISVGVAAVIALIVSVRAQRAITSQFLRTLSNDMAHVEDALREAVVALERVADSQERVAQMLRDLQSRSRPRSRTA